MGVVVVRRWAREDGVSVGWGAAELEPPQVLCVDGFVALQHFDGLVHGEPLPLTACRGRQGTVYELKLKLSYWVFLVSPNKVQLERQNIQIRSVLCYYTEDPYSIQPFQLVDLDQSYFF